MKTPIVIGSPVQFIDHLGHIRAAIIVELTIDREDRWASLHVCGPYERGSKTIHNVLEHEPDATVLTPDRWRPLPLPAAPVAEFPVQQFVELVKPLIEEAARMRVEEILAARSSSSS